MKQNIILAGALSGLISAAKLDFDAFRRWKSFDEALSYNWGIALWRWLQGGIIGAVTGAGLFEVAA
jgi:hypothetical protein